MRRPPASTIMLRALHLRMLHRVGHGLHRTARHSRRLQQRHPVRRPAAASAPLPGRFFRASACRVRSRLVGKRGSPASSGRPSAWHSRPNRASLPAAMISGRSAVGVGLEGRDRRMAVADAAGDLRRSPHSARRALSRIAIWPSSMLTSTFSPAPVRSRWYRALPMPASRNRPPVMSPMEVPALVGGPPGWPVTLISPPSACTIMS